MTVGDSEKKPKKFYESQHCIQNANIDTVKNMIINYI